MQSTTIDKQQKYYGVTSMASAYRAALLTLFVVVDVGWQNGRQSRQSLLTILPCSKQTNQQKMRKQCPSSSSSSSSSFKPSRAMDYLYGHQSVHGTCNAISFFFCPHAFSLSLRARMASCFAIPSYLSSLCSPCSPFAW